jgi:small basic protein
MTGKQVFDAVRGYIGSAFDRAIAWLKWVTGAAIVVALFLMVGEQYGISLPFTVVSNNVTTWAYLAGIYWLSR